MNILTLILKVVIFLPILIASIALFKNGKFFGGFILLAIVIICAILPIFGISLFYKIFGNTFITRIFG